MTDEILQAAARPATRFDSGTAWEAVSSRIDDDGDRADESRLAGVRQGWRLALRTYAWLPIVAVVVIATVNYMPDKTESQTKTYTTAPGQRVNIQLADGSRVALGPATKLTLIQDSKGSTMVDVAGEALFTVNHSATHAFTVKSHGVTTRVLGTQFVVRAYDASHVRVAVRAGRVSVQSPAVTDANAVAVNMGNAATVTTNGIPVVTAIEDLATDFAWADGELVLRGIPLGEALARISRWYGMEFKVDDPSLLALDVDMTFPARFSPQHLQLFADVLGASIHKSGSVVTISRRK